MAERNPSVIVSREPTGGVVPLDFPRPLSADTRTNSHQIEQNDQEQQSEFADSSGPFFTMYREMTEEEDNKMAERWQKDAEGIIIFVSPCLLPKPLDKRGQQL
jgi:hypothetical protein